MGQSVSFSMQYMMENVLLFPSDSSAVFSTVHLASNVCLSTHTSCEVVAAERLSSGFGVTAASFTSGSVSSLHCDYIFTSSFDTFLACSVGVCCFADYRRGGAMKMKREREAKSLCFGVHVMPSCARQRWKNDFLPPEPSQQLPRSIIMVNIAWFLSKVSINV